MKKPSNVFSLLLLALAFVATAEPARAQEANASIDAIGGQIRRDISGLGLEDPGFEELYAPASEGDEDLGVQRILQRVPIYRPWRFQATSGFYWTDNAALTEANKLEDIYLDTFFRADYVPLLDWISPNTYANIFASYEFYRYDNNSFLDFDELEAGVGLTQVLRNHGNLSLYGRYNYDRITEAADYTEVFVNHSMVLGALKPFRLAPDQYAYTRLEADFSLDANPGLLRRHEYSFLMGYRWEVCDELTMDAYYRLRYYDYVTAGGNDWNHQPGVALTYKLCEDFRVIASAYWVHNDSSRQFGDYSATNLGGFLTFSVDF